MITLTVLVLMSVTCGLEATMPDIQSFMPNIFAIIPGMNGRVSMNDQVFTFGEGQSQLTTSSTIPISGGQPPAFNQQMPQPIVGQLLPTNVINIPDNFAENSPQTVRQSGSQDRIQIVDMSPIMFSSGPFPSNNGPSNGQSFGSQKTNFGNTPSRVPSFDSNSPSIHPPFETQIQRSNPTSQLPNIGSTELGSTFANNANNANFADEFSRPSPSSAATFGGLPFPNNRFQSQQAFRPNGRPNMNAEDPLVVMPLMVSPDRLLQQSNNNTKTGDATTTELPPLPPPMFAAASDVNERSEPSEWTPAASVSSAAFGLPADSVKVSRQTTSFIVPMPTMRQISSDSSIDSSMRSALERHLPPFFENNQNERVFNATDIESSQPFRDTIIPINFVDLFRPQNIPTLAELDKQSQDKQSSTPSTSPQVNTTTITTTTSAPIDRPTIQLN